MMVAFAGALGGCGAFGAQPVACTAESAAEPVVGIVREQLEKRLADELKNGDGKRMVSLANIRASVGELLIELTDVRTSKKDPNSTKRFCAATLAVKFPADMLTDADRARDSAGMGDVSDLADENDVGREANRFTTPIEFEIQPTDDGSKVFAETATDNAMFAFASEVVGAGLMRSRLENAKREEQQAQAAASAEQDAALAEQRQANLASVRTDNQLAAQTIGAMWKALDSGTRQQLLPVQRAWIRKKDADCRVEAASASTDPAEMESARVACDTRATRERIDWLSQYRSAEPVYAPTPAPASTSDTDAYDRTDI
ncbi:lysozyme inhibitor LprI family protein [Sphingomonas lenta]|nr:lysozyme inhibitor LprI family protein [Sphingomonas lenta]